MKELDPHIKKIIQWRESFATLPDSHFFELIRMYLGEIHTPFNKQKLIEDLGAFLRKAENRKTIASLLSESDIQLLAAVKFIPGATQEKLAEFFSGTFTFASLYERLLNLEERLLIFRHSEPYGKKMYVSVNPMLDDILEPLTPLSSILEEPVYAEKNFDASSNLTPELLAAFVSFIQTSPDLCKNDGTFKKRAVAEIEEIFPGREKSIEYLTRAFINLSLLKESDSGYEVDRLRLGAFARLEPILQYCYLCVASQGRFSRSGLVRQSRIFLETAFKIPESGYSRPVLLRSAYLLSQKDEDIPGVASAASQSRFSAMLRQAASRESDTAENATSVIPLVDRILEPAAAFGLLEIAGKDESGNEIFVTGSLLKNLSGSENLQNEVKALNIDAGFTVTVMPGLTFDRLLPLMDFMSVDRFDLAPVFEISKKSVMHAFDSGLDCKKILELLKKYSLYELPQNLTVSIDDWSKSYSSAALYKGWVLRVNEESREVTERNPNIKPYITEILAPGVYLLSVQSDEEARALIAKSGLDFIGSVKSAAKSDEVVSFPLFDLDEICAKNDLPPQVESEALSTEEERSGHFDRMRAELDKLSMTPEQKDGLLERIQKKIVLTPAQLRADSVRLEQREAGGMDFNGKIHLIEGAISSNAMIELTYDLPSGGENVILGSPLAIEKGELDSSVTILLEPEHIEKSFSVGQAKFIKKIRGSILK